jgi:hypothetical protein
MLPQGLQLYDNDNSACDNGASGCDGMHCCVRPGKSVRKYIRKQLTRLKSNKYNPDSREALALVHHTPLTLGGLDMTHTCLIHVVRALEGHETELGALTDANRRRDFN